MVSRGFDLVEGNQSNKKKDSSHLVSQEEHVIRPYLVRPF